MNDFKTMPVMEEKIRKGKYTPEYDTLKAGERG